MGACLKAVTALSVVSCSQTAYASSKPLSVSAEIRAANDALHAARVRQGVTRETRPASSGWLSALVEMPPLSEEVVDEPAAPVTPKQTLTVSTDLLLALLRNKASNEGRIWLLARAIDVLGRGCVAVSELRNALTKKSSPLYVCGGRRLRQILASGAGRFWQRDNFGRIWLKGQAVVAATLGISHARLAHIDLPINALTGSISHARANFYTALHSARPTSSPISRASISNLTGTSDRTQLRYDKALGVEKKQALAVGASFSQGNLREKRWQGRVAFQFTDRLGKVGKANAAYVAWHLPNQYQGLHALANKTVGKRFRKQLTRYNSTHNQTDLSSDKPQGRFDLAITRAQGNKPDQLFSKRYFEQCVGLKAGISEAYLLDRTSGVWLNFSK